MLQVKSKLKNELPTDLKMESIPLKELSSLAEDIHVKTREASQNTTTLEEVENDPTYTDEQRQLYRDRLDDLNTKKQARLELLSQNWKDIQTQVARIKQTIAKVLDQDTSLAEGIRTLFCEQGITIFTILTALSMTISMIVLAVTGAFGGGVGTGGSPPKDEGGFEEMVRQAGKRTKKTCRKGY